MDNDRYHQQQPHVLRDDSSCTLVVPNLVDTGSHDDPPLSGTFSNTVKDTCHANAEGVFANISSVEDHLATMNGFIKGFLGAKQ